MTFDEYQAAAKTTAVYPPEHRVHYPALGLAGEAGEVCEKVKKRLRDGTPDETFRPAVAAELGDVLWYCAALASDLGLSLADVAAGNLRKLADRKERNRLHGSGDGR
jgi:NTP pyrophosphatase (non-canonical NTP hydrolase)